MLDKLFSWLWVNHPRLKAPDAMLTFSAAALVVCCLKVLLNDCVFSYGTYTITCGKIDATVIAAMLGPTLMAYVQRKKQDSPDSEAK